ncbi:MAG: UDP-N-acetylmuramoyl-tripeptide--D-alanyl-D-alanine ligase [Candidatus Paceibacterota bacterium]
MIEANSNIVVLFWLFVEMKSLLFWVYLWQLKDYHIGRFLAHFQTANGRNAYLGLQNRLKFLLFLAAVLTAYFYNSLPTEFARLLFNLLPFAIAWLYIFLGVKAAFSLLFGKTATPKLNLKTIFLLMMGAGMFLVLEEKITSIILSFHWLFLISGGNTIALLIIDLLLPIALSFLIIFLQPLTVVWRTFVILAAKIKRSQLKNLKVIGITGSYGKSTTKEILAHILSTDFRVVKTPKNQNSEIGIANTILKSLKKDTQYFICEMGAYNKGGIKFLCDIAKPQMGILSGINEQHLATFGSLANTTSAKFELIRYLKKGDKAILNFANDLIKREAQKQKFAAQPISVGDNKGDYSYTVKSLTKNSVEFLFCGQNQKTDILINLPGGLGLVQNASLAIAAALQCGISLQAIAASLKLLSSEISPYKLVRSASGREIILATYSANPESVRGALQYLSLFSGKKIFIMPCLIELGSSAKKIHEEFGRLIAQNCDLAIITSRDYYSEIKNGAIAQGTAPGRILFMSEGKAIAKLLAQFTESGDTIMISGRVNQIIENEAQKV